MRRMLCTSILCTSAVLALISVALAAPAKLLQIYCIDVEGGQSTLIVDPRGESLLVDTGWPGFDGRDANRIVAAADAAGIQRIDYLVITHYHRDHVGGVEQLAAKMKIGTFVDHGPNMEDSDSTREGYATYLKVSAHSRRIVMKPGGRLPFQGMSVKFLTAAGDEITAPLPGAGQPNPYCASEPQAVTDPTENARSLGMLITYGKFRFIDLGDLTKQKEIQLVCPNNLIGAVDLYLVTHHGYDLSNSRAIVDALHPRVAIMDNGPHKGDAPAAWQIVHDSPGLEDLWQLHYGMDAGADHNVADTFIGNLGDKDDAGNYIEVTAEKDGTFTVINSRNNYEKTYAK
ncbi:MAG: MBL fold metallo-hydrolase [Candidatus Acidiferrales bacterium]